MSIARAKARIAVSGGIAEGKSTVIRDLADCGLTTLNVDDIVDRMWADPVFVGLITADSHLKGASTKAEAREAIAESEEARLALNRLTHREVARQMMVADVDAIEVPLLIEACLYDRFEEVWIVTCGMEEQRRRLVDRVGEIQAEQLLRLQLPTRAKLPFADIIVRTDSAPSNVSSFVRKVLQSRQPRL